MWRRWLGKEPVHRGRSSRQVAWWTLGGLAVAYAAWKLSSLTRGVAEEQWRGDGEPKQ